MNKKLWVLPLIGLLLLTACSREPSWDEEAVEEVSQRIMADDVNVAWTLEDSGDPQAKGAKRIRLAIAKRDGTPIESFELNHEKLLHLIIVSKDLSYFNHIHPAYKGGGVFEIDNTFPAGGQYRMVADFTPTDGDDMTKLEWVEVPGAPADPVPVVPDETLNGTDGGTRVTLAADKLAAKEDVTLTFTLSDATGGQPVTDLEPYLGAIGHVVILSEDGNRYVHVHAEEGQGSGPEAVFEATFPGSGIYKIWGQFQRGGKVLTVPYVVTVE